MRENNSKLSVIWRNQAPSREAAYPRTWILEAENGRAVKLHVGHDAASRPFVQDRALPSRIRACASRASATPWPCSSGA